MCSVFSVQEEGSRLDETLYVDFRENLITQASRYSGRRDLLAGACGLNGLEKSLEKHAADSDRQSRK